MPIHDWTLVPDVVFLNMHLSWCVELKRKLNSGLLPPDHYALLQWSEFAVDRRWQNSIAVKHIRDDRTVAVIEIVSAGNKESNRALRAFVDKAVDLLAKGVHLLVIDLCPPTRRDPRGIHSVIWEELAGGEFHPSEGEPLTVIAYEAALPTAAYLESLRVGGTLPDMPVFLRAGMYVLLPLEETYTSAYQTVPLRWQRVIDGE